MAGGLRDHAALTDAAGVCEELLLEVLGDPLLDDDVVGVRLIPVPFEAVGQQGVREKMLAMDLVISY